MKARLVILLAIAAGLAVYFAVRTPTPSAAISEDEPVFLGSGGQNLKSTRVQQTMLGSRPLPGRKPSEPPELDIRLEVDPTGKKNRIYYYLSEVHGYYVEEFNIDFFYKPTPDTEYDDSPLIVNAIIQNYIKAGETLENCVEVTWAELENIGGSMGTSENWGARIKSHGRYRASNPDPLPRLPKQAQCLEP